MSHLRRSWFGLIGSSALCACGSSPPTRFYTLNQVAPSSSPDALASNTMPVRVEPVAIPAELDRLELVTHNGPNRVHIQESDRWAAPLDEQIRRILSDDLAARSAKHGVADPNEPATDDPRRRLSVEIAQIDADENCAVSLHASWTLRTPHAASQSGSERIEVPASAPCPASLPAAISTALANFADRLAPILGLQQ
jgi:uncharacterized lipoprotein YmbA